MKTIRTEDGVELKEGDRAYDYYSMKPGYILKFDNDPREDQYINSEQQGSKKPWFSFQHDEGTRQYLNGQRICSMEYAIRRGFKGAA
jgi:hypothetical protein